MKLAQLLQLFKGGNKALEYKLNNLLSEDCQILEYTDDAVLFTKNNKLVLAKFKHNLSESSLSADDLLDNEVVTISKIELEQELKESLCKAIANLADGNLVDANETLDKFTESFYQYGVLRSAYSNLFVESMTKQSKGFGLRKTAFDAIPKFKGAILAAISMSESHKPSVVSLAEVLQKHGVVLALGKKAVSSVVESIVADEKIANDVITSLYEMAESLEDSNDDLKDPLENDYDLEAGAYPTEDIDDIDGEDYTAPVEDEIPAEGDEEVPTFEPFDPSKLSPEEKEQLHKDTLKSIIQTISDFVKTKANDPHETDFDINLDKHIDQDLEALSGDDLTADDLSDIEARWSPVLDAFMNSDLYKTKEDEFELPAEVGEGSPDAEGVDEVGIGDATGEEGGMAPEGMEEVPGEEPFGNEEENPEGVF